VFLSSLAMTFHYDAGSGLIQTASQYHATVLPHTIQHYEFWVFIILHFIFKFMFMAGLLPGADIDGSELFVSWENVSVITGMTTFFEVFYSNQSYQRYLHLYTKSRRLLSGLLDMSLFLSFTCKAKEPGYARLAFRYLVSSTVIFFEQLQSTDKEIHETAWNRMVRQGLLKPDEQKYIASLPKHERTVRLLQWTAQIIQIACKKAKVPATMEKDVYAHLLQIRDRQQEIQDVLSLPVPFQYFHVLNVMVLANVALWCYKMAISKSVFAPFTFILAQLIFLGMMELASQLSNPFGTDDVDFPSNDWVTDFIASSIGLIEDDSPGQRDQWSKIASVESMMKAESKSERCVGSSAS